MSAKQFKKHQIENGKWVTAPAAGLRPLFQTLAGAEILDRDSNTFAFNPDLRGVYATPESITKRQQAIADYNAGTRWI